MNRGSVCTIFVVCLCRPDRLHPLRSGPRRRGIIRAETAGRRGARLLNAGRGLRRWRGRRRCGPRRPPGPGRDWFRRCRRWRTTAGWLPGGEFTDYWKREAAAIELHASGLGYAEIAVQLGFAGPSGAFKAVDRGLRAERDGRAGEYLTTQISRYEALLRDWWPRATTGHEAKAANILLRVLERLDRLLRRPMQRSPPARRRWFCLRIQKPICGNSSRSPRSARAVPTSGRSSCATRA